MGENARQRLHVGGAANHSFVKFRTLEHAAGVGHYTDSGGRVWGLKTFRLREMPYFNRLLFTAFRYTGKGIHPRLQRLAWVRFVQACVCCHDSHVGIFIKFRRMIGLPDYSRRQVKRLVTHTPPDIADAIIWANLEYKSIVEMLQKDEEEEHKKEGAGGWGAICANYLMHIKILPDDLFNMTMPQLNAMGEALKDEDDKRRYQNNRAAVENINDPTVFGVKRKR